MLLDSGLRRNDGNGRAMSTLAAVAATLLLALCIGCAPTDAELEARIAPAVDAALAGAVPPDLSRVYQRAWPSVFYIEPADGQHGAGWLLEPGFIVTSAHVVADEEVVVIRQAAAPPFTAAVAGLDRRRDVALLRYTVAEVRLGAGATPLPLGDPDIGDIAKALLALGYSGSGVKPGGEVGSPKANAGILSQITNFGPHSYGRNLEMDTPIDPGDSGGPVLNASGAVAGMARAAARRTPGGGQVVGTFYAIHADEIRAALAEIRNRESPAPQR